MMNANNTYASKSKRSKKQKQHRNNRKRLQASVSKGTSCGDCAADDNGHDFEDKDCFWSNKIFSQFSISTQFLRYPCKYSYNSIIYAIDSDIYWYNVESDSNQLIASWKYDEDYRYSENHSIIYSQTRNTLYSIASLQDDQLFVTLLLIFNLSNMKKDAIPLDHHVGYSLPLTLSDDDNFLHIICNDVDSYSSNTKHIRLDLNTYKSCIIQVFEQISLYSGMIIANNSKHEIYMYGVTNEQNKEKEFWIYESPKTFNYKTKQILNVWYEYKYDTFISNDIVNLIISYRGSYHWYRNQEYAASDPCSYANGYLGGLQESGHVLYDDRIIIIFGGISPQKDEGRCWNLTDIWYLDLNDDKGWRKNHKFYSLPTEFQGAAVLLENDKVHLIPSCKGLPYIIVNISDILPLELL